MNQQSFEESLRQSQITANQSKKEKKQQEKKVQFKPEDYQDVLAMLSNTGQKPKRSEKQKVAEGKLDFIFNPSRDITAAKPYHEDGDANLYTDEMIRKRQQLKTNPEVVEVINKFIENYKFDGKDKLVKDEYLKVQIKLASLLRDDLVEEEDIEDLKFTLDQDWDHDSLGKGYMTREDLFNSIFELVDIWTPDAEKDQYLGFFEILTERFQYQPQQKIDLKFYEMIGEKIV